jgi:hypothetical protein
MSAQPEQLSAVMVEGQICSSAPLQEATWPQCD